MKNLLILFVLLFTYSVITALEPVRVAIVTSSGNTLNVDVELFDYNLNTSLHTLSLGNLTANSSGIISFIVDGGAPAWSGINASAVNSNVVLNVTTGGNLYAQYRLDNLMLVQAQTGNGTAMAGTTTLSIGDSYQGGIIFWLDESGEHGLIAATADQSTGIQWWNGAYTVTNTVRDGIGAGEYNTERIIAIQGAGNYAAQICANYQVGNYGDWYLPSKYELNLLYLQKTVVGGFANSYYWSSSEVDLNLAWIRQFGSGTQANYNKNVSTRVRAIRSF